MFVKGDPRLPSNCSSPALGLACSAAGGRQVLLSQTQLCRPEAMGLGLSPPPPVPQLPLPRRGGLAQTISGRLRLWRGRQCPQVRRRDPTLGSEPKPETAVGRLGGLVFKLPRPPGTVLGHRHRRARGFPSPNPSVFKRPRSAADCGEKLSWHWCKLLARAW